MKKQVDSIIQKLNKKRYKEASELIRYFSILVIHSEEDAGLEAMFGRVMKILESIYENMKRITKEWLKIVDEIIKALNDICFRLKKERKNMLKDNNIFRKFLSVYVEENMKEIVKNQLWEKIIITVIFYYGDREYAKHHRLTKIGWVDELSKEMQEEYIMQSEMGLREYVEKTGDWEIKAFEEWFEEEIRSEIETFLE